MKKGNFKKPTVAPGDERVLQAKASEKDIRQGNYTRVTTLSYDEVDTSKED